jgi:hypothetical protein
MVCCERSDNVGKGPQRPDLALVSLSFVAIHDNSHVAVGILRHAHAGGIANFLMPAMPCRGD